MPNIKHQLSNIKHQSLTIHLCRSLDPRPETVPRCRPSQLLTSNPTKPLHCNMHSPHPATRQSPFPASSPARTSTLNRAGWRTPHLRPPRRTCRSTVPRVKVSPIYAAPSHAPNACAGSVASASTSCTLTTVLAGEPVPVVKAQQVGSCPSSLISDDATHIVRVYSEEGILSCV